MKYNELYKETEKEEFDSLPIEQKIDILHKSATKDIENAIEESGLSKVIGDGI